MSIERRLSRIRRSVLDPDRPEHCAMWVDARYLEPFGSRKVAIVVAFLGGKAAELGRSSSIRRALTIAEKNLAEQRKKVINPRPRLVSVDRFLYRKDTIYDYDFPR